MKVASRAQYSMPFGGSVSTGLPDMETTLSGFGVIAFTPRVDPQLFDALHGTQDVVVHHDAADHEVVVAHRPLQDVVAVSGTLAVVARGEEEKLSPLALVGTGHADVGDRTLPEVVDQAHGRPGRDIDNDRSRLPRSMFAKA